MTPGSTLTPKHSLLRDLIIVGAVAALALGGTLWWVGSHEYRRLDEDALGRAHRNVELAELLLQKRLEHGKTVALAIASSRAVQDALESHNTLALHAALDPFQPEFSSILVVIDDAEHHPMAWSVPLAMLACGLDFDPPSASPPPPRLDRLHADLAVFLKQPIQVQGRLLGNVRLVVLLGRLFLEQTALDVSAPLALVFRGQFVHSTFSGSFSWPPPGFRPGSTISVRRAEINKEPVSLAWKPIAGFEKQALIISSASRTEQEAAFKQFVRIILAWGTGQLVLVLFAVGIALKESQTQQRLLFQRDEADRRSQGIADRLAHLQAVVHDIKAPVGGIQLRSESLLETTSDPPSRHAIERIIETCERLTLYLVNVLTAAQAEEGPIPIKREVILIPGLLHEVAERVAPLLERKSLALEIHFDQDLPPIKGDPVLLERALQNLAANAVSASSPNGKIAFYSHREPEAVILGVRDQGPGFVAFSPEKAFSRERPRVKDASLRAGSSGLGLYIVARIAEAHGGAAEARNGKDGGAEVEIRLPYSISAGL